MIEETEDEEGEVYWNGFRKRSCWLIVPQAVLEFSKDIAELNVSKVSLEYLLDTYASMARTIAACISAAIKNAHVQGLFGLHTLDPILTNICRH